ncbi:MAG: diadenylate cyclase CdaA [Candidatus Omnitrophica bacterium]|nr:diadenylate cyclase CdaA [Candidatus Omnitrophota bacterium]
METVNVWKIVLEILILWYVIYMILLFVKGTRSEQLLKGLVIVTLIFIGTQQLGLNVINWVITRLFPISVIALLFVFQPELRRGLAQLGQFGRHQENIEAMDEVSKAAAALARKKIGALIVIERETGLKSYVETGTVIDSEVTAYLITSIFLQQSPLHDGAIILQHGRLTAAGCVLPLPQEEKDLPKYMGMRHRAAVGISEETDAVCVVVSEETGNISVANGGKLHYGLDEDNLNKMLKDLFCKPAKRRERVRVLPSLKAKKG